MSDNEHTLTSLGHSEVLSVQNPVGEPIPELCQPSEEGSKRPSFVNGQDTGHIFPNDPTGSISRSGIQKSEGKIATRSSHARSLSSDGEVLAGCSAHKNVDCACWPVFAFIEVSVVGRIWPVVAQDSTGERLNLRDEGAMPGERSPRDGSRFNAAADAAECHGIASCSSSWRARVGMRLAGIWRTRRSSGHSVQSPP